MVGQVIRRGLLALGAAGALLLTACPPTLLLNEITNRSVGVYTQLASLTISSGALSPKFASDVTEYTVNVDNVKTSVTLRPVTKQSGVTITVNEETVTSGSDSSPVALTVGANTVTVDVAYPGSETTTYTITVTRLSNADLSSLVVAAVGGQPPLSLSPSFAPSVTSYTVNGYKSNTDFIVTPTAASSTATLALNGTAIASGSSTTINCSSGSVIFAIAVTGSDGTSKTYTVSVTCAASTVYVPDLSWGVQGRIGSDMTSPGKLSDPQYVATDGTYLFVTDSRNGTIQEFSLGGTLIARWTGSQISNGPTGVAYYYDSAASTGFLYVGENSNQVLKINASTGAVVSSWGSFGTGTGQFNQPQGVAVDTSGNVYVVDRWNSRVQVFDKNGTWIRSFGSAPSGGGHFNDPRGVAVDATGNVIVVDASSMNVQSYDSSGAFKYVAPNGTATHVPSGPSGVAVDGSGAVYVTDSYNRSILKYANATLASVTVFTPTVLGSGAPIFGQPVGIAFVGTTGIVVDTDNRSVQRAVTTNDWSLGASWTPVCHDDLTSDGCFYKPTRLALDISDNLYVADSGNNRIQKFSAAGVFQSKFGSYGTGNLLFKNPCAIAVDSGGNVYVGDVDNYLVKKYNPSYTYMTSWPLVAGHGYRPAGMAISGTSIFISDSDNYLVRKYDLSGTDSGVTLGTGSGSNNGQFGSANYPNGPQGLSVYGGNVYVADPSNQRVQVFNATTGAVGTPWATQAYGDGRQSPADVVVDQSTGNIYVLDSNYGNIQLYDNPGHTLQLSWPPRNSNAGLDWPQGIVIDSQRNIYVAVTNDCSVRKYKPQ